MVDKLFVYGTLLKQSGNMMAAYLKSKTEFISDALLPGLLYKVDFYPGALYQPDAAQMVLGELYHLTDVDRALEVLDTYEDYHAESPEGSLFVREVVEVFAGEETHRCWAYLYNLPVDNLRLISSGDFLRFEVERH
jgi:gamma-glutamylcyclotransferase (GGCT)/AIG2-like uncharacterized protein YtfP